MNKRFLKQVAPLLISLSIVGGLSLLVRKFAKEAPVPFERLIVEVLPEIPDLEGWPEEFVDRLHAEHGALADAEGQLVALENLARLYHANGFVSQAQSCYLGLEGAEPMNPEWPYLMAVLKGDFDDKSEAIRLLERVTQLDPTDSFAYLKLGDAYLGAGKFAEAKRAYEKRLLGSPGDGWALSGLGKVAMGQGDWQEAKRRLLEARQADPEIAAPYELLPEVYFELGDVEAAREIRSEGVVLGLKFDPEDLSLDFLEAYCYDTQQLMIWARESRRAGDLDRAIDLLKRAWELDPENSGAMAELQEISDDLSAQ